MVQINLSGQTPSNTGGSKPGNQSSGNAPSGSNRQAGYDAAKLAYNDGERKKVNDDYTKALKARADEEQKEAHAWADQSKREGAARAKLVAVLERESRMREQQLVAEQRMQHRLSQLRDRSAAPLTPSAYRAVNRAASQVAFQDKLHAQKYGASALPTGAVNNLRGGLGSEGAAYKVANALRVGDQANRAHVRGDYVEAAKLRRELGRLDRQADRDSKAARTPEQHQDAARQRGALSVARSRLSAGRAGNNGMFGGVQMALGEGAAALEAASGVLGAIGAVATLPFVANKSYSALQAARQPWLSMQQKMGALASSGGYSAESQQAEIFRGGVAGMVPGHALSDKLDALGISPSQYSASLNAYGINPQSAGQATSIATSIRTGFLSPYMGLSEDQLGGMLGTARTAGSINGGALFDSDSNKFFQTPQRIMAISTTQGIDRSKLVGTFGALISSPGLAAANPKAMAEFQANMISSGAPGARSGEDATSLLSDIDKSAASLGTGENPTGNLVFGSYFAKRGGVPTSEAALKKSLGLSDDEFNSMTNTDAGKKALAGFLSASKSGDPYALAYLGQLLQNQPDVMQRVLKGSSYGSLLGDANLGPRIQAGFFGTNLPKSLEYSAGNAGGGSQLPGVGASLPPPELMAKITAAANKYGVPVDAALALFRKESNFENVKSGDPNSSAKGYGQMTDATARAMGYDPSQMMDADSNIDASMKYYSQQLQSSGGNPVTAYEKYHYGPGGGYNQKDADQFQTLRQPYTGTAMQLNAMRPGAEGEASGLMGTKYLSDAVSVATTGFQSLSQATTELIQRFRQLGAAVPSSGRQSLHDWLQAPLDGPVSHDAGGAYGVPAK